MYVLPFSPNEALVEYTLFSKDLLDDEEYETAINDYLKEKRQGNTPLLKKNKEASP